MSSIVLEPGIKDMNLNDCKDFLRSEEWYAERGIPFRRGYLEGVLHALSTDIHSPFAVTRLLSFTPSLVSSASACVSSRSRSRFIVLLEDLDAGGVSRDANSTGAPMSTEDSSSSSRNSSEKEIDGNTVSLSELLNSLDGVPGADGW